jgi:hypothetical protein
MLSVIRAGTAIVFLVAMVVQGTRSLAADALQGAGAIAGYVVSSPGNIPAVRIAVTVISPSEIYRSQTDAQGFFRITNVAPDTYAITISGPGIESEIVSGITVSPGQTAVVPNIITTRQLTIIGH